MVLLPSCSSAKPENPKTLGVSVHSINYSSKEVALIVIDPLNESNSSGGDVLNPYGMGGTICCFGVPSTWHAGYQVIVKYMFYPEKIWHEQLVNIPPYGMQNVGNIWLAMHEDGRAEAVISNNGPTSTEWSGRIKGMPVPSEQYIEKIRNERINTQKRILSKMEEGYKQGTDDLTPEQTEMLVRAIEDTKKRIRLMEESKP